LIPRQLLKVPIPASVGIKGTAAKSISPLRKDLLAKCLYGCNISRKKNLVNKQSKGKKCTKAVGKVDVPHEAFMAVLKLDKIK
jgi:GTP-binding protein LepA